MRTKNRASRAGANAPTKHASGASGKKKKAFAIDMEPAIRASRRIRRDVYVSPERRREPITV